MNFVASRLVGREGRVAQGHGAHAQRAPPRRDRHPLPLGGRRRAASPRWTDAAIVNAGDGKHEHPTQALLDVYTLRRRLGTLEGANIWIVGDVLHSRVARSNILAFQAHGRDGDGRRAADADPARHRGARLRGRATTLDDLREADVVYALRMQHERMSESYVPSLREYAAAYQIDGRRLGPARSSCTRAPSTAASSSPGEVVDSPQSLDRSTRSRPGSWCGWRCSTRCSASTGAPASPSPEPAARMSA